MGPLFVGGNLSEDVRKELKIYLIPAIHDFWTVDIRYVIQIKVLLYWSFDYYVALFCLGPSWIISWLDNYKQLIGGIKSVTQMLKTKSINFLGLVLKEQSASERSQGSEP